MFLPQPTESGGFQRCPEGNHVAVCYEVIDLGTQRKVYDGQEKQQRQILIGWETSSELMDDGRPFVISKRYTFSSHEKSTLRQHLESWRGKRFSDDEIGSFDIRNLLGTACLLNVVHTDRGDKTYANISAVTALPKGTATPDLSNEKTFLSLDPGEYDVATFERLSDRMKDTIRQSPEWQSIDGGEVVTTTSGSSMERMQQSDEATPF